MCELWLNNYCERMRECALCSMKKWHSKSPDRHWVWTHNRSDRTSSSRGRMSTVQGSLWIEQPASKCSYVNLWHCHRRSTTAEYIECWCTTKFCIGNKCNDSNELMSNVWILRIHWSMVRRAANQMKCWRGYENWTELMMMWSIVEQEMKNHGTFWMKYVELLFIFAQCIRTKRSNAI